MTLIHCSLQLIQQVHTLNAGGGVGGTFLCFSIQAEALQRHSVPLRKRCQRHAQNRKLSTCWPGETPSGDALETFCVFFRGGGVRTLILQDPAANAVEKHQAVTPDADDY